MGAAGEIESELLSESGVELAGANQPQFASGGRVTASGKLEPLIFLLIVC